MRKRHSRRRAVDKRAPTLVEPKADARWSLDLVHDQFAGSASPSRWKFLAGKAATNAAWCLANVSLQSGVTVHRGRCLPAGRRLVLSPSLAGRLSTPGPFDQSRAPSDPLFDPGLH